MVHTFNTTNSYSIVHLLFLTGHILNLDKNLFVFVLIHLLKWLRIISTHILFIPTQLILILYLRASKRFPRNRTHVNHILFSSHRGLSRTRSEATRSIGACTLPPLFKHLISQSLSLLRRRRLVAKLALPHLLLLLSLHAHLTLLDQILYQFEPSLLGFVCCIVRIAYLMQLGAIKVALLVKYFVLQHLVKHVAGVADELHLVLVFRARVAVHLACGVFQVVLVHQLDIVIVFCVILLQFLVDVECLGPEVADIAVEEDERVRNLIVVIRQVRQDHLVFFGDEGFDGEAAGLLFFFVRLDSDELINVELRPYVRFEAVRFLFAVIPGADYLNRFSVDVPVL